MLRAGYVCMMESDWMEKRFFCYTVFFCGFDEETRRSDFLGRGSEDCFFEKNLRLLVFLVFGMILRSCLGGGGGGLIHF
jgi:hypothetical protein